MKNYNKNIFLGIALLAGASLITSCSEDDLDMSYDRLFHPTKMSVTPTATDAYVSWNSTPNTEYYLIEVSSDSLYNDVELDPSKILTYGEDGSITKANYTVDNLIGDTNYFIRIKSMSSQKESTWYYYENNNKRSFKTKSEQILDAVTSADKGEDFVTLNWSAGLSVTHVEYFKVVGEDVEPEILREELTEENVAEGSVTISGLEAATSYTFSIYFGEAKRGTRTASTSSKAPEGNVRHYFNPGDELTQELLDGYADAGSVTFILNEGSSIKWDKVSAEADAKTVTIPAGLSVTFYGAPGAAKPTIELAASIEIATGTASYINFENVDFVMNGSDYVINAGNAFSVSDMTFKGCTFDKVSRSIIRFKDNASISVTNLVIEDCIISNQGAGAYAVFYWNNAAYTVENFTMRNTTVMSAVHNFLDFRSSNMSAIVIDNCTFYDVVGSGRYFIDCQNIAPSINISNSIFALANTAAFADGIWTSTSKGVRSNSTASVSNVYFTADFVFGSNAFKPTDNYSGTSADLFVNPAEGDLYFKDLNFSGFNKVGDPRWFVED